MLQQLTLVFVPLVINWGFAQIYEGDLCVDTFSQAVGRCADVEKCESAKLDLLAGKQSTPCGSNNDSLVCCKDGATELDDALGATADTPVPVRRLIRKARSNSNRRPGRISARKCRKYISDVTETVFFIPLGLHDTNREENEPKCVYRGTELIVGGEKAALAEFPHMAAVGWKTASGGYDFNCGGGLISENFVLSAAHCTYSEASLNKLPEVVRLGDLNLDPNVDDGATPVQVTIKTIHKHPDYHSPLRYNDIALFELENNVAFNDYIRPACLWLDSGFGNNKKSIATGWGTTETGGEKSNDLRKVSLTILDNASCNNELSDLMNRFWREGFAETQMCAGETRQGKDTCQGDSGSPLQVIADENRCIFKLIGLTSFGPPTCGNRPAVYTRVSSYVSWIENIVWPNE